jgi:hypothetical protein
VSPSPSYDVNIRPRRTLDARLGRLSRSLSLAISRSFSLLLARIPVRPRNHLCLRVLSFSLSLSLSLTSTSFSLKAIQSALSSIFNSFLPYLYLDGVKQNDRGFRFVSTSTYPLSIPSSSLYNAMIPFRLIQLHGRRPVLLAPSPSSSPSLSCP